MSRPTHPLRGSLMLEGEHRGVRVKRADGGIRLAAAGLAGIAGLVLLAAAAHPLRSKPNAVWEWENVATARAALAVGVGCLLAGAGIAAASWGGTATRAGRLLAAEAALALVVVTCALVLLRSGTWLIGVRAAPIP
jgi:hypothetical protein